MAPFQDSLASLASGRDDRGGVVVFSGLPGSVRELIDGADVGVVDPASGRRFPNQAFRDSSRGAVNDSMFVAGVAGLDRFRALGELFASRIAPGRDVAIHLADAAIRGKQELNLVQAVGVEQMTPGVFDLFGRLDPDGVRRLSAMVDDASLSALLAIAAENPRACSEVLTDPVRRAELLGLNWRDGAGVAAVVAAGTGRDLSAAADQQTKAATAALAVVQEVASDRDGYLSRMDDQVKAAVTNVGLQYLDALSSPNSQGVPSSVLGGRTDAVGRPVGPTLQLSYWDQHLFLQFVSGTGDDNAALFQGDAKLWACAVIVDALTTRNELMIRYALADAGGIDGEIFDANVNYTMDLIHRGDRRAIAISRTIGVESRAGQGFLNAVEGVGSNGPVALGSSLPFGPSSVELAVATKLAKGMISIKKPPPAPEPTLLDIGQAEGKVLANEMLDRSILIGEALKRAGYFSPGHLPDALKFRDSDHDGNVDPLTDIMIRDLDAEASIVGLDSYEEARGTEYIGHWDGPGAPRRSVWRDAGRVRGLAYGLPDPRGWAVELPADPRVLDSVR
jgi:hypothetical protein